MALASSQIKILHIITGLGQGGAEQMLCKLVEHANQKKFDMYVVALTGDGPSGYRLHSANISLNFLNMSPGHISLNGLMRLWLLLRDIKPDVIQTWLYHADLLGGLFSKLSGVGNVVWNIRNTNLDTDKTKFHTRLVVRLCALLSSSIPSRIICNSHRSALAHQTLGYSKESFSIIPNGFSLELFSPNVSKRAQLRHLFRIADDCVVLGHVARFDPLKNHRGLLKAFSQVDQLNSPLKLICCGSGVTSENEEITGLLKELDIQKKVLLLGPREDISDLMQAFDFLVLPSFGESFPNVVGEAMASGVPCLVSDVGDCAEIVGETGWVVLPNDEESLVNGLRTAISCSVEERYARGCAARERIANNYKMEDIAQRYEDLYVSLVN